MKKIKLITLAGTALVGLTQLVWAGPRGGGGGIGGGGHVSGFAGGARFGGGHVSSYAGGFRGAPLSSGGGARFGGRSVAAVSRTPQQFYYYSGARTSGLTQHAFIQQTPNRSTTQYGGRSATVTHRQNRAPSPARQDSRIGKSQMTAAAVRRAMANHRVFARHDGNWHRDWDRHRAHFDHGHVFVFVDDFWWGLYPWDYYPDDAYGSYPSDYDGYPYGDSDYPYDSYDYNTQEPYSYYNGYAGAVQNGDGVVSSVQSQLAKRGYYRAAIDGVAGDETQAAIARYQEDNDLSVTGTVTAATLQSLGLAGR